jgi:hypothetical protein
VVAASVKMTKYQPVGEKPAFDVYGCHRVQGLLSISDQILFSSKRFVVESHGCSLNLKFALACPWSTSSTGLECLARVRNPKLFPSRKNHHFTRNPGGQNQFGTVRMLPSQNELLCLAHLYGSSSDRRPEERLLPEQHHQLGKD